MTTVQILGAEKALKKQNTTPKYNSSSTEPASSKLDKISLASRVDALGLSTSGLYDEAIRSRVQQRLPPILTAFQPSSSNCPTPVRKISDSDSESDPYSSPVYDDDGDTDRDRSSDDSDDDTDNHRQLLSGSTPSLEELSKQLAEALKISDFTSALQLSTTIQDRLKDKLAVLNCDDS